MLTRIAKSARLVGLIGLIEVAACGPHSLASGRPDAPLSVCAAFERASLGRLQHVTVKGIFISDQIERSFLYDEQCRGKIIYLRDTSVTIKDSSYALFSQLLYSEASSSGALKLDLVIKGTLERPIRNEAQFKVTQYVSVAPVK